MSETYHFFMAMQPPTATHQQKQVRVVKGKPIFFEPDNVKRARGKLKDYLAGHVPDEPFDKALHVAVKWFFPTDQKQYSDGQWKTTTPDTHNLNKLLFDVMTDLKYWTDDSIVTSELIQKFWVKTSPPGIYIEIKELE